MPFDDDWDFLNDFVPNSSEDGFEPSSRYDPRNHIERDTLTELDPYKSSNIVEADEPIALADSIKEGLVIEVYQGRRDSLFDLPKQMLGKLDDFILHVDYRPPKESDTIEYADSLALDKNYFGFNEEDADQVVEYLNEFSEDEYSEFIRASDLEQPDQPSPGPF